MEPPKEEECMSVTSPLVQHALHSPPNHNYFLSYLYKYGTGNQVTGTLNLRGMNKRKEN